MYLVVKSKFFIALLIATAWLALCIWLAFPWVQDLAQHIGMVLSFIIIFFIALLPGFMNAFLLVGYLIDKRPKSKEITLWPDISVIIPAFNEHKLIAQTVQAIADQKYPGNIEIIVVDNGSEDNTLNILQSLAISNLVIATENTRGKSYALNKGLSLAKHDYILTIDADTYLLPDAAKEVMTRFLSAPANTAAVAGSVYVKNSRETFMTRLQEWDYFHSIAAVKRLQSLFQGTLVAQGAFSLYKKIYIEEAGGWPPTVGEDIVLTWALLEKGYRIDFSENAIAFTYVPTTYKAFFLQRSRWSRGMIEAFLAHPRVLITPNLSTFLIYWDLLFPAIDACYFFIFIPGIIAALFGYYFIAGPMTLAVLPLAILINVIFFLGQKRLFTENVLKVRRNKLGFVGYMLFYYLLMVPACLYGYLSEVFQSKKVWGKK